MKVPAADRELVRITDAALAEAARQAGTWLACKPGCNQCCHGVFAINQLDLLRLRAGMENLAASYSALAQEIGRRATDWLEVYGPAFPGDLRTGLLDESVDGLARFENYANDAPCPALDPATGQCDLYAWRPMTCRIFGPPVRTGVENALGCCELCFAGATNAEIAACEMPLPRELEESLLAELPFEGTTVVAFALQTGFYAAPRPPAR